MEAPTETSKAVVSRKNVGLGRQLIAATVMALGTLNAGIVQGWMSPMTNILTSSDSPVGILDSSELGFVASVSNYIAFPSGLITSYTAERFGRRATLILAGIPAIIGHLLFAVCSTKLVLYIGRCLSAFTMVSISLGPMYLSESAHESIRGTLITFTNLALCVGIVVAYTMYRFVNFRLTSYILATELAVLIGLVFVLPETPYYLASKSRTKAASKAMTWFRGGNAEVATAELNTMKTEQGDQEKLTFVQSFKTKEARAALFIGSVLYLLQTLSGIHIILNYAEMIFTETKSPLQADSTAIFTSIINLVATSVCVLLIDRVGRKPLLYFSLVVGFISHLSLTIVFFLISSGHASPNMGILAVICVTCFVFSYGVGMGAVPALILNEISSVEIKPYVGMFAFVISIVLLTGFLQLFPILTTSVGMYVNFIVPTLSNFLGIFFLWFYVPETKGKSLNEIASILRGD